MGSENLNMDEITEARRKAIAETIKPINIAQLKALGDEIFPYHDHPWRETYFTFITENANASFYYGTTSDRLYVIYCHDQDKGMWFLPGRGKGPLQAKGLKILREIVEGKH
jgi:hypothetical protein